ncbi:hypothetical protein PROFUN_00300 [Planoprotostelium fungivorum]|uniref:RING finger protein 141 n=1 Tax=Planoprotostelium fungivorum TaxID=1890364 RepID=A0A2P6NY11_9EUKA|nr:hypothetical protein PROFUN_00300 [Planoprotostelium fungivorum]
MEATISSPELPKSMEDLKTHITIANESLTTSSLTQYFSKEHHEASCHLELTHLPQFLETNNLPFWKLLANIQLRSNVDGRTKKILSLKQFSIFYVQLLEMMKSSQDPSMRTSGCQEIVETTLSADNDTDCIICFEKKADIALQCTHAFCSDCLKEWKQRSQTCPVCRAQLSALSKPDEDWVLMGNGKLNKLDEFAFLANCLRAAGHT